MDFSALDRAIAPPDEGAMAEARRRWDSVAKPLGSLGLLEDALVRIAGLTGTAAPALAPREVLTLCADHGVVCEGVTQTGQEVTALVAASLLRGQSSVCRMAAVAGARVTPVDMGMATRVAGVSGPHIADGTANLARGPAMTPEQGARALQWGIDQAAQCKADGCALLLTGEMGIGNTTSASALASSLLALPPEETVGRGAGLSDEGLACKRAAVARGLQCNAPLLGEPFDALCALGGFDIAGMAGLFLGGALHRIPVLIDGFISAVAALASVRLCPASRCAMLATHVSAEPLCRRVLDALGLPPLICAGMRLGEGTGAVAALPLLDMALAVYQGSASFGTLGMAQYVPQEGAE